jgi:hypothetical protein
VVQVALANNNAFNATQADRCTELARLGFSGYLAKLEGMYGNGSQIALAQAQAAFPNEPNCETCSESEHEAAQHVQLGNTDDADRPFFPGSDGITTPAQGTAFYPGADDADDAESKFAALFASPEEQREWEIVQGCIDEAQANDEREAADAAAYAMAERDEQARQLRAHRAEARAYREASARAAEQLAEVERERASAAAVAATLAREDERENIGQELEALERGRREILQLLSDNAVRIVKAAPTTFEPTPELRAERTTLEGKLAAIDVEIAPLKQRLGALGRPCR